MNLTKDEARVKEQRYIEKHGLDNLENKINGMAKKFAKLTNN